ncbi:MAG TPA: porin [Vicinamibacterales bacterium]|nr:porin [Vicinamibacterales bacterium]
MRRAAAGTLLIVIFCCWSRTAWGQQPSGGQTSPGTKPESLDNEAPEAGDEELGVPARRLITFNEFNGDTVTFRVGGGFLYEFAAYSQDEQSKEQFALFPEWKVRDARIVFKGSFKGAKRTTTWSTGLMWDVPTQKFLFRETGVMFEVPEIWGNIFVGRTKEGISLNKVMVGYAGWTMERTPISDAAIPILADGIKWLGWVPKKHLLWNFGVYGDWLSEGQTFSTYAHQVDGRIAWVPMESETKGRVLHLGLNLRFGKPDDNKLQLRSRPEVFEAPFFVDTGTFAANSTKLAGIEAYYRPGPLLVGSEYYFLKADAPASGNPLVNGGNVVMSWLPTGETRVYNTKGGYFNQISPLRPVFQGGPGAWEIVTNFSYINLDSGAIQGGKFWRFTPMVNWHLSDNVRLEMTYGYGSLDRFGLVGKTQFFQTRIQLQL